MPCGQDIITPGITVEDKGLIQENQRVAMDNVNVSL